MGAQVCLVGKRKAGENPALSRNCETMTVLIFRQQRKMKSACVQVRKPARNKIHWLTHG